MANSPDRHRPHRNILRRLPPSLSIDSAHTATNRPLFPPEREALATLNKLKEFLANAPTRWSPPDAPGSIPLPNPTLRPALNRFSLPSNEYVTCVLWQGQYYISGTDIVRSLVFRFEAFGRPVRNMKKFEEGVFSDLRNLKPGTDATLEEPKSAFLDLLYKYQCIRTQKKQKVFYWFSVPHDRLFFDALERDIKRESMGTEPASVVTNEPALSFKPNLSSGKTLWEEWMSKVKKLQESGELKDEPEALSMITSPTGDHQSQVWGGMLELFEGSPAYKQRRKRRSPVQTRTTDMYLPQDMDSSSRRQSSLVRSASLGSSRAPRQEYQPVKTEPQQTSFYPSSLPNHSSPNLNLLPSQATTSQVPIPYPSVLPFASSENILLDQTPHVVRSHSSTGYHRPLVHSQDTSTRPSYNPYPRPQPRMTQSRHSTDTATTSATMKQDPHLYASTHALYASSQSQSQQSLTVPLNLQSTYPNTNSPIAADNGVGDNSVLRAYGCPSCGKLFQRSENWQQHVNEHLRLGEDIKLNQEMNEYYTQVFPGQHIEDAFSWGVPQGTERQYGSLPTVLPGTVTVTEPSSYSAGPMGPASAWVNSPFSSSASTRSGPPPSPSSSPSGSLNASAHHASAYNQKPEYMQRPVHNAGYEGASGGFYPAQRRGETPGMESRPQTASSYDSAANPAYTGRHAGVEVSYGRHSSAPVMVSSSPVSGMYDVQQPSTSFYYGSGDTTAYASNQTSETTTSAYQGSPSMEEFQQPVVSAAGAQYSVPGSAGSGVHSGAPGYAPSGYSDGPTRAAWGTEYHSTPSPPDNYHGEASQPQHQQQPMQGAMNSTEDTMRYYHGSAAS